MRCFNMTKVDAENVQTRYRKTLCAWEPNNSKIVEKSNDITREALEDLYKIDMTQIDKFKDTDGDNEKYTETKLFIELKPLIFFMKCFGLYFHRNATGKTNKPNPLFIYSSVLVLLLFGNVVRAIHNCTFIVAKDAVLFNKITVTLLSTSAFLKAVIMIVYWFKYDGFRLFFIQYDLAFRDQDIQKKLKKVTRMSIGHCLITILGNFLGVTIWTLCSDEMFMFILDIAYPDGSKSNHKFVVLGVFSFFSIFVTSTAVFPVAFMMSLSYPIILGFDFIKKRLSEISSPDEIENIRKKYEMLTDLVQLLERFFSKSVGASIGIDVTMFCLLLFNVTNANMSIELIFFHLFWLLMMVIHLISICVVAAWLNSASLLPLDSLHKIDMSKASPEKHLSLTMFVSKLNGPPVGITALKLFMVDSSTLLTVAGLMVSYYIVVLEFKVSKGTTCNCIVNGTGT